jgi:4-carboxymuconolactone decarboxylase
MARVRYVHPAGRDDGEQGRLLAAVEESFGRVANFWRILAHSPHLLKFMVPLSLAVQRDEGWSLAPHLKRLAVLRASKLNECGYCVSHNTALALRQGLPPAKLAALDILDLDRADALTETERAVLAWTDAVTRNTARRQTDTFAELERHLSTVEIVELTVAVAHRNMINRIQEALWTDLEDEDSPRSTLGSTGRGDRARTADRWVREVLS